MWHARAGAHRRISRWRRMDRSHEDDVRVLIDDMLRGVSTRAHRTGAVVGAHGDAPSSRHGDALSAFGKSERIKWKISHRLSSRNGRANSLEVLHFRRIVKKRSGEAGWHVMSTALSRAKEHRTLGRAHHCRARTGFRLARTRSRVPPSILFARREVRAIVRACRPAACARASFAQPVDFQIVPGRASPPDDDRTPSRAERAETRRASRHGGRGSSQDQVRGHLRRRYAARLVREPSPRDEPRRPRRVHPPFFPFARSLTPSARAASRPVPRRR